MKDIAVACDEAQTESAALHGTVYVYFVREQPSQRGRTVTRSHPFAAWEIEAVKQAGGIVTLQGVYCDGEEIGGTG